MPTHKLSDKCEKDVDRYIDLRFSHWSGFDRAKRKKQTKLALSKLSKEEQDSYSEKVDDMFEKNAEFLESCERSRQKALFESRKSVKESVAEALRGNHDQQH